MADRPLGGKVAMVTGAGRRRGIGRAIALRLAEDGAAVAVTAVARPPESFPEHERQAGWRGIASVAEEIEAAGGQALALDLDVTSPDAVRTAAERVRKEFGRIDILVNNAGLAVVSGKKNLWEMDDDEWFREIDVNLHGVYHCCRAVIPALLEQGEGGRIINISSLAGREGQAQYGGYTPAKFAVVGLTQMLAKELAPHKITVNAVCPGSTDTDMMDGTFGRTEARMGLPQGSIKQMVRTFIPLGRQAEPREMAGIISYLASPAADYITGQSILVDGGILMR
jgi:3-oxoacyl-[acyl-carrier protein] reductase/meso-butanediol dehydrogenase/(S,S)-butanediol dehydrogenase/diacetyl reductase